MEEKPNTYVKPSLIHGLGLFASCDIKQGEEIIHGEPDYSNHTLEWMKYQREAKIPSWNLAMGFCMINHSEQPNTIRGKEDRVLASLDIKAGSEITEDYTKLPDNHNPFTAFNLPKEMFESFHLYGDK